MDKKVIKMAVYTSETCHLKLDIKTINMSLFLRGGVFRCKTSTSAKNTWPYYILYLTNRATLARTVLKLLMPAPDFELAIIRG